MQKTIHLYWINLRRIVAFILGTLVILTYLALTWRLP